jgi:hypothetical protein
MTIGFPLGFSQQYDSHLKHLKLKGLQPKTIDAYARAIRRLGKYFDYRIDDLSEAQLTEYFSDLTTKFFCQEYNGRIQCKGSRSSARGFDVLGVPRYLQRCRLCANARLDPSQTNSDCVEVVDYMTNRIEKWAKCWCLH